MIDLNTLDLSEQGDAGYKMQVQHPIDNTEIEGMTIRIRGDKSKTVQAFERKRVNEMQKREKLLKGKNKSTDFTIDELEEMAVEAAVVRIMGWTGMQEGGEVLDYSPENAAYLMKKFPWMREQVREAAEDLENFRLD